MKIKHKLLLSALISVVLSVFFIWLVFVVSSKISEKGEKDRLTMAIETAVSELSILNYEYLLYREKRMEEQWNRKYNSSAIILRKAGKETVKGIRDDYVALGRIFLQVTKNYKKIQSLALAKVPQDKIDAVTLLEKRLVTQLLIKSRSIITEASKLSHQSHTESEDIQRLANTLFVILMVTLAMTITTISILVARNISKTLHQLIKDTEIIGGGNLDYELKVHTKDEFGKLSQAFNKMTENLKRITSSRDELNIEISERKRVEEELRQHQCHLDELVRTRTAEIDTINKELEAEIVERKRSEEALRKSEERLTQYTGRLEEMVEERTKDLKEAQAQLVRSEKLAVLGKMAGGVGHELRNPLGVMNNAVYYLKTTLNDTEETTKEYLEIISSEIYNADKIVSDLLDFSRVKPAEREKTALSELVAQVLEKHQAPENVEVTAAIPPDLCTVFVDPGKIDQVLVNLVTNAYQAMTDAGRLTVRAREEQNKVSLSITDTGCGISKANMQNIFEPLFTTKARGIGLGLAVSRSLVEASGGSIKVESEEGKGSTFTLILPTKAAVS